MIIDANSPDPSRPFLNLLPLIDALVAKGNACVGSGFILEPDGWRCRLRKPIDFRFLSANFTLPPNIRVSTAHDTVLDEWSWASIEGPGAGRFRLAHSAKG